MGMPVDDRLLQFGNTLRRRIFREVGLNGFNRCSLNVVRRGEIGFARTKIDHIMTFSFQSGGRGQNRSGRTEEIRDTLADSFMAFHFFSEFLLDQGRNQSFHRSTKFEDFPNQAGSSNSCRLRRAS